MITSIIIEVYSEASDDTFGKQPWKETKLKDNNCTIIWKLCRNFYNLLEIKPAVLNTGLQYSKSVQSRLTVPPHALM